MEAAQIPESVRRQVERADILWKERYGQPTEEEKVKAEEVRKAKEEAEKKAKEAAPPNGEDYEQKFKVLKGKYDAEVPAMAFTIAELKARLDKVEKGDTPPNTPPPPAKSTIDDIPEVKVIREDYPDLYAGLKPIIKETIKEELGQIDAKLEKKIDEKSAADKFDEGLVKEVADWRVLNKDPEFLAWLKEPDPAGYARNKHALLIDAWNNMDVGRTAKFFKDFKEGKKKADGANMLDPESGGFEPPRGGNTPPVDRGSNELDEGAVRMQLKALYDEGALAGRGRGKYYGKEADFKKEEERLLNLIIKIRNQNRS